MIALVNEEFFEIQRLCKDIPDFSNEDDLIEAKALIVEALKKATTIHQDSLKELQKVKKQLHFVQTQANEANFIQNI
ncbi:MAG: hypothetical protein DSZ06_01010 [Sulfurospirillum sp.]|nr:MAG: hypothetical protein DSZ06_01010 [Sulfurospirillum sp.]